jgi:sulfur relay protein TusD/DsrE
MIYTLIIRSNHLNNNYNALSFAQELLKLQHSINIIYFLFDGSYIANAFIDPPTDEYNFTAAWTQLAQQHNVKLSVCAASGLRRGIVAHNIAPGFNIGSIGELVASCDSADRVVTL